MRNPLELLVSAPSDYSGIFACLWVQAADSGGGKKKRSKKFTARLVLLWILFFLSFSPSSSSSSFQSACRFPFPSPQMLSWAFLVKKRQSGLCLFILPKNGRWTVHLKKYLFVYFWLCLVFVAVCGHSLVAAGGDYSLAVARGLSNCGWLSCGLITARHVQSFRTRDRTHVPCIGKQILHHWTTREVPEWFTF